MRDQEHKLDSLGADPSLKSLWISQQVSEELDYDRTSLLPEILDTLKAMINNPIVIEMIEKKNNHYLAIENREFDKLALKSSDNLKDISDGEALLKKIVEPYKGKFVLLDVWGTWCGPCKEALSDSQEEYERLKDYDIAYLYLANKSPKELWEKIIKEYNVTGDNVAHYNLPKEQQQAIERYLNIHSWPSYKLFDRNGNLLDLEVDAREIDDLIHLLDKLK
jgi:thiol-disulfide isomerase/thioredoxin